MDKVYDYIVVGGGIVGVSTAWQLKTRFPDKSILLLEKEDGFAKHQTGHNSGVIHAGVYYAPGSLKAEFCKKGEEQTKAFCAKHDIAIENCGKLLVATSDLEVERMNALYQRCADNGIEAELLNQEQLKLAEPNITGFGAILVHSTSIVDYKLVTEKMAEQFTNLGGEVCLRTEVISMTESASEIEIETRVDGQGMLLQAEFVVTCSGLMADRVTKMLGIECDFQIIPYRGEYYRLNRKHNDVVNLSLIHI